MDKDFEKLQEKSLDLTVASLQKDGECTKAICDISIPENLKNIKMTKNSKIVVFGATGLVGSAIVKKLIEKGFTNIICTYHKRLPTTHYPLPTFIQLDLLDPIAV